MLENQVGVSPAGNVAKGFMQHSRFEFSAFRNETHRHRDANCDCPDCLGHTEVLAPPTPTITNLGPVVLDENSQEPETGKQT